MGETEVVNEIKRKRGDENFWDEAPYLSSQDAQAPKDGVFVVDEEAFKKTEELKTENIGFVQVIDEASGETIITTEEDPKVVEEKKKRKEFMDYVLNLSKIKPVFPKDFGKPNTLRGMVNTQHAALNRKERRKMLSRVVKQWDSHVKGLRNKAKNTEQEENDQLQSGQTN